MSSDEYYTPEKVWESIIHLLTDKTNKGMVVYEPFFGQGHTFNYFNKQGYITLGEKNERFFTFDSDVNLKLCDCVITNPPFSIKYEIIEHLVKLDVPFIIIYPLQSTTTMKFRKCFDDKMDHVTMIIPKGRIKFINTNDEIKSPNFDSCYVCYKMFDKQLIFLNK